MVLGIPPYGYDSAKVNGKSTLVIREEEAKNVRLIYRWYLEGDADGNRLSITDIARKLTLMGVPTYLKTRDARTGQNRPSVNRWSRGSVRKILANETYAGIWHWGKTKGSDRQPRSNWIPVEVPAIVSRETWVAVQDRLAENRRNLRGKGKDNRYLIRQRVRCGQCGSAVAANTVSQQGRPVYRYYRCPASKDPTHYSRECDLAPVSCCCCRWCSLAVAQEKTDRSRPTGAGVVGDS